MRTLFLLFLLTIVFLIPAPAQWITSMYLKPANPAVTDPITLYADLMFPTGSCHEHAKGVVINGYDIHATAIHCLGMLTVICYHTDSFTVGPLPAGTYKFRFELTTGSLPFPCSPGPFPKTSDSLFFTVSPATGIETTTGTPLVIFHDQLLIVTGSWSGSYDLKVYDLWGRRLQTHHLKDVPMTVDVSALPTGFYVYVLNNDGLVRTGTFIR